MEFSWIGGFDKIWENILHFLFDWFWHAGVETIPLRYGFPMSLEVWWKYKKSEFPSGSDRINGETSCFQEILQRNSIHYEFTIKGV